MKEGTKVSLSVLLAAILIGGGLCALAWSLRGLSFPAAPSSLYVTTTEDQPYDIGRDFLSLTEASVYTGISEDALRQLTASGKLEGCFVQGSGVMDGGGLIFSREKLKLALEALIEQGEGLLTQGA